MVRAGGVAQGPHVWAWSPRAAPDGLRDLEQVATPRSIWVPCLQRQAARSAPWGWHVATTSRWQLLCPGRLDPWLLRAAGVPAGCRSRHPQQESCAVRPRAWNGARFKTGVSAYPRADAPQSPPSRGRSLHTPEAPGSGGDLLSEPTMGEGGVSAGGAFRPGEHAAGRWGCRVQTRPPGTAAGERRAWRGPC